MNWLDITLILTTIAGAWLGYKSGLVWQVVRLLSWIVSFWLAGRYHQDFGGRVRDLAAINFPPWASYFTILISTLLFFYFFAYICRSVVDAICLKLVDRITGSLLGALKVCLIATAVIIYLHLYVGSGTFLRDAISSSYFASRITNLVDRL